MICRKSENNTSVMQFEEVNSEMRDSSSFSSSSPNFVKQHNSPLRQASDHRVEGTLYVLVEDYEVLGKDARAASLAVTS